MGSPSDFSTPSVHSVMLDRICVSEKVNNKEDINKTPSI